MNQTFLAVISGLLCALIGMRRAAYLRSEARRLSAWHDALQRLQLLLCEATLPLPDALRRAGNGLSAPDKALTAAADLLLAQPLLTLPEIFEQVLVVSPEQPVLLHLAEELSHGSLDSRCLACEQCTALISQLASEAATRAARDVKLFQTLGWSGGICLTLILI